MKKSHHIPVPKNELSIFEFLTKPRFDYCFITYENEALGYTLPPNQIIITKPIFIPELFIQLIKMNAKFHTDNRAYNMLAQWTKEYISTNNKQHKDFLAELIALKGDTNIDKNIEDLYKTLILYIAGTKKNFKFQKELAKFLKIF